MVNIIFAACSIFLASSAGAGELIISGESDGLYLKSLPYLARIDEIKNDIFDERDQLSANDSFPADKKRRYMDELKKLVEEALPLLTRSAEQGHPAAQYRLALAIYTFGNREENTEYTCGLLKSSLSKGFTPAALQMTYSCTSDVTTPDFRALISALPNNEDRYVRYYPQPTMMPSCDRGSRSQEKSIVPLDEKGFRANIYMALARQMSALQHRQEQLAYLKKAAGYGCTEAINRLKVSVGN